MTKFIIAGGEYVKHPVNEGVFMKHFYSSADNDKLNNVELRIDPGFQIAPHIHEKSTEFFYVVSGTGEFFIEGEWTKVQKGFAMKAPLAVQHAIKNISNEPLILFSTFTPFIR